MDLADYPPHFRHEMDTIIGSVRRHVRDNFGLPKTDEYYRRLDILLEPLGADLDPTKQSDHDWL